MPHRTLNIDNGKKHNNLDPSKKVIYPEINPRLKHPCQKLTTTEDQNICYQRFKKIKNFKNECRTARKNGDKHHKSCSQLKELRQRVPGFKKSEIEQKKELKMALRSNNVEEFSRLQAEENSKSLALSDLESELADLALDVDYPEQKSETTKSQVESATKDQESKKGFSFADLGLNFNFASILKSVYG